ncbi:MAG: hypothetical protein IIC67_12070 [Thaumarchaeota archaeon]|nr:hypothetical protein [Nitrososphaerota archaeon]
MTGRTTIINDSDEVMAMLGSSGELYRGKWRDIKVTKVGEDKDTPLDVRKSLVGLIIPTIFDKQQLESQGIKLEIPDDSRMAYATDVIDKLKSAGKHEEANQLEEIAPDLLDMYVFEEGTYEIL